MDDPQTYQPRQPGRFFAIGWIVLVFIVLAVTTGLVFAHARRLDNQASAIGRQLELGPRVLVTRASRAPLTRSIDLPGTIRGFVETPVYAKISGYLKVIAVDKGDRVRRGQLLATLESPELDHQVANAQATYHLAEVTDRRNQNLLHAHVIARQAADESQAQMVEARAALNQLLATRGYKQIVAPFDGIVTARYVDPGALIPQSTTPAAANTPLFALATLSPVRIYADVPQSIAPFVRDGDPATITVTEYPGRIFEGVVTRHPEALASATRTMLVEIDLPNADRNLLPGMYARVNLRVTAPQGPPLAPDDALVFRDGKTYIPVVQQDHLHLREVALGYDDGINVEITKGISGDDLIALNVGQAARDGEPVRPMTAQEAH